MRGYWNAPEELIDPIGRTTVTSFGHRGKVLLVLRQGLFSRKEDDPGANSPGFSSALGPTSFPAAERKRKGAGLQKRAKRSAAVNDGVAKSTG